MVFRKNRRNVSSSIEKKLDDAQTKERMLYSNDKSHQPFLINPTAKERGNFGEQTRKTLKLTIGQTSSRQKFDRNEQLLKLLFHADTATIAAQSNKKSQSIHS